MRLRMIAPVPVDLQIAPGAASRDPAAYDEFWRRARGRVPTHHSIGPTFLHAPHVVADSVEPQYVTIADDALERPLELVRFSVAPAAVPVAAPTSSASGLVDVCTGAQLDLLDNGVMLVECTFVLPADARPLAGFEADEDVPVADVLDALSRRAQGFVVELVELAMREWIEPTLAALRSVPGAQRVLATPVDEAVARIGPPLGVPMWVARQLTVPRPSLEAADDVAPVVAAWLRDVPAGSRSHVEVLAAGDEHHVTRWLNYVAIDPDAHELAEAGRSPGSGGDEVWRALRVAQWTYAALDVVDRRLAGVLAQAMADDDRWELGQLRTALERLARRATLVQLHRDEVTKYLHRDVRREFRAILRWWDFEELVAGPVATKVAMCRQRIDELEQERARRSRFVTDLILQALVVTSILGTVLGLAQFGRSIATDPAFSGADVGRGNVVGWFAAQPADALLVLSAGLSLLVLLVYFSLRRFHQ